MYKLSMRGYPISHRNPDVFVDLLLAPSSLGAEPAYGITVVVEQEDRTPRRSYGATWTYEDGTRFDMLGGTQVTEREVLREVGGGPCYGITYVRLEAQQAEVMDSFERDVTGHCGGHDF